MNCPDCTGPAELFSRADLLDDGRNEPVWGCWTCRKELPAPIVREPLTSRTVKISTSRQARAAFLQARDARREAASTLPSGHSLISELMAAENHLRDKWDAVKTRELQTAIGPLFTQHADSSR